MPRLRGLLLHQSRKLSNQAVENVTRAFFPPKSDTCLCGGALCDCWSHLLLSSARVVGRASPAYGLACRGQLSRFQLGLLGLEAAPAALIEHDFDCSSHTHAHTKTPVSSLDVLEMCLETSSLSWPACMLASFSISTQKHLRQGIHSILQGFSGSAIQTKAKPEDVVQRKLVPHYY